MTNGNQFLKSKGLIAQDKKEFIIIFKDGKEINLGDLLMDFSKVNYDRAEVLETTLKEINYELDQIGQGRPKIQKIVDRVIPRNKLI